MSRVTAIISLWLSASSSACHGLLIITVITPYLQSPARQKCQKTKLANAAMQPCRCVSVMLLHRCKIHEGLADAKADRCSLRDDVAAGRRRLHIKAVCQSVREATTAPAWIMQPPPTRQTPLNRIISPSREKLRPGENNWKNPEVY